MKTSRLLCFFAILPGLFAAATASGQALTGTSLSVTGAGASNLSGVLNVVGAIDSDSNTFTFGTQSGSYGGALLYTDSSTDTLKFLINRNPAAWAWVHNTNITAMRLDSAHQLLLYQANGTTAGVTLTPVSNQVSLGTATLTGSGTGLTAGGAFTATGALTASAGITNTNGSLTGGASGLTLTAGGTNQNITLTPSGTGNTILNGNVGIGTTSPSAKLDVLKASGDAIQIKTADANPARLDLGNTGSLWYMTASRTGTGSFLPLTFWTSDNERMRLDTAGNLGIGATSPAGKLDVSGIPDNGSVYFRSTGRPFLTIEGGINNYKTLRLSDSAAFRWDFNSLPGNDGSNPHGFGLWSSAGQVLAITPSGNVGIGTASPSIKLDVMNAATGDVEVARFLNPNIATGNYGYINVGGNDSQFSGAFLGFQKTGTNTGIASLGVRGSGGTISINQLGNVGIGTTTPNYTLSFGPNLGKVLALYENNGTNLYGLSAGGAGTGPDPYRLKLFANGGEFMSINSAGFVGVGTSNPYNNLAVVGGITAGSGTSAATGTNAATITASATKAQLYLIRSVGTWSDTWWEWTHDNDNKLKLGFSGVPQAEFANGQAAFLGNVGIGVTTPGSKLEVAAVDPVVRIHNTNDASGAFIGDTYGVTQIGRYNPTGSLYGVIGAGMHRSMLGMDANGRVGTLTNNYGNAVWRNMLDDGNGNVGIGTTTPNASIDIWKSYYAGTDSLRFSFNDGSAYWMGIQPYVAGGANVGYRFRTNNVNTTVDAMAITGDGKIGMGTLNPTHKLSVNGTIRAKEIIVDTGWADYVFDESYRLAPLAEVEQHIRSNKHLPGIPSAQEIAEHGVSMGDMQSKLLSKIEELTLHMIAQEKLLLAQQKENSELRQRVQALENNQ